MTGEPEIQSLMNGTDGQSPGVYLVPIALPPGSGHKKQLAVSARGTDLNQLETWPAALNGGSVPRESQATYLPLADAWIKLLEGFPFSAVGHGSFRYPVTPKSAQDRMAAFASSFPALTQGPVPYFAVYERTPAGLLRQRQSHPKKREPRLKNKAKTNGVVTISTQLMVKTPTVNTSMILM